MHRIEIKNFGPIRNVAFDIKDYTIFIGPQASGKSTIARAVYFFRSFYDELYPVISSSISSFHTDEVCCAFKENIAKKALTIWDSVFWNSKSSLSFHYEKDFGVTLTQTDNGEIVVSLTTEWTNLFRRAEATLHHNRTQEMKDDVVMLSFAMNIMGDAFLKPLFSFLQSRHTFIPAGRVLFSNVEAGLIPREQRLADVFAARFFDFCKLLKQKYNPQSKQRSLPFSENDVDPNVFYKIRSLSWDILGGTVELKNNKCYLALPSQEELIQITNASSGQQEAVWILLYIIYVCDRNFSDVFTVIEEPEAHLFPESQQNMMYVLTLLVNQSDNQLMLTTHSPYILTPLNNLLLAHKIGQNNRESTEKVVDPDLWIDPDRFECYYVDNGTINSIVDRETGLMDLEKLDAVSGILNEQYDRLSELED